MYAPQAAGDPASGQVIFKQRVKVHRVVITSPEPTYALGVGFVDQAPDIEQQIEQLFQHAATEVEGGAGA